MACVVPFPGNTSCFGKTPVHFMTSVLDRTTVSGCYHSFSAGLFGHIIFLCFSVRTGPKGLRTGGVSAHGPVPLF
ncbi:hypothetical protein LptCag_2511 [Leptospirillum ferriphilum]|uniref:Uncharacterized protein n=1 Tax=Leptospirillum ferriphilum TaxID=178606 RepID=A0A094WHE1_9BACT|nr:hypothetical protein LptCag_2511 [Leptospirillum ferriphilum]